MGVVWTSEPPFSGSSPIYTILYNGIMSGCSDGVFLFHVGNILDNSANEFFVGFSLNIVAMDSHYIFVTTAETSPVTFTVTGTDLSFTGRVSMGSSVMVNVSVVSFTVLSSKERNKGIYIKAEREKKIRVYGINYAPHSADAFLALPCNTLLVDEYEYYGVSYPSNRFSSTLLIVACADNTEVSTASGNIMLNRQETYLISLQDSTGYRVTSSKPVAFFSNHECSQVPKASPCDHLSEQIPPTVTWGKSFLVASLLGRNFSDLLRIVAANALTTVIMNCTTLTQQRTFNLDIAGSWEEIEINPPSFCSIESSKPILLVQFALGTGIDSEGDTFMSMIPPITQYSNNYVLEAFNLGYMSYMTLYVSPEHFHPNSILVDNVPLNTEWTAVYCSNMVCGYIARFAVSPGTHRVLHQRQNARLGVSMYGFILSGSYGYPGGLQLTPVQSKLKGSLHTLHGLPFLFF